jgi:hypothetical protein
MFESVLPHTEALRDGGQTGRGTPISPLSICPSCRTIQTTAVPVRGMCCECGGPMAPLDGADAEEAFTTAA